MAELLARTLAERDPDMRVAARLHRQETAVLVDLKSELAIEIFGDREIGNSEMKPVNRMNAEFAGTSSRLDGAANGGHGNSPRSQGRTQPCERSNSNLLGRAGAPITMAPQRSVDALKEIPPASIIDSVLLSPFRRMSKCGCYLGRGAQVKCAFRNRVNFPSSLCSA